MVLPFATMQCVPEANTPLPDGFTITTRRDRCSGGDLLIGGEPFTDRARSRRAGRDGALPRW